MEPEDMAHTGTAKPVAREPRWVQEWLGKVDKDIWLHNQVIRGGYPNRWGAQIPVESKWNLELFSKLLEGYYDRDITEWIRYGWPTGRLPTLEEPQHSRKNHKGATEHPQALRQYIQKEQKHRAVMGPYKKIPFKDRVGISPLSTREKKISEERRIILDLSFPVGHSVNDGILKDNYLGFEAKLTFPKVDELAVRVFSLGKGCYMFKIDLSRYFRQIPLDPGDYPMIGYIIEDDIYFDKVLPMGMRSAPYIAQRISNAIAHIMEKVQYFILNYVDDFVGAETLHKVWQAFEMLTKVLRELQVDTAPDKVIAPTTRLEFLGIIFDSETMTMEVPEDKLERNQAGAKQLAIENCSQKKRN